ncbi:MAG TPA: Hsp20/alpha crystallin family protein [Solirubrobacterales bacterium]|nr:Hsp20/alpha crystallin family protein [Solirubrobacterales bacterium]
MPSTLAGWSPFTDLAELRRRFDRLFEETEAGGRAWSPSVDLIRGDDELTLKADLPGITPEEVEIEVVDGVLTVSGEHTEEREEGDERYLRRERRRGSFRRSMTLPEGVEPERIEAAVADGLLEVRIPLPAAGKATQTVKIKPTAGSD